MKQLPLVFLLLIFSGIVFFHSCKNKKEEQGKEPQETAHKPDPFTGPQSCRPCHQAIVDSFLLSGKGRSLLPASHAGELAKWTQIKAVADVHRDLFYLPEKRGGDFFITEFRLEGQDTIHLRREKVSRVIGSGNQTVSFLLEENGYLYEMPLTWYRKKAIWDLSPGYEKGGNQRFDREIGTECMECHSSGFQPIPHSLNRYSSSGFAISCQACHGDVNTHLEEMKKGGRKDLHILNLAKCEPQIQMDVCRQCHLEGIKIPRDKSPAGNYSPGKRFSDYFEIFIPGSGKQEFGFASHAERLQQSQCYIQSKGALTCTGCHDPHARLPPDPAAFFNEKCSSCHAGEKHQTVCKVSKSGSSNCISCHLRSSGTSDIPHVNSTDHWIRRKPASQTSITEGSDLKHFAGRKFSRRELGKAYLFLAETRADSMSISRVKEFLNELPPTDQLFYQYLRKDAGLPKTDTQNFSQSADPLIRFRWAEVKKRSGLPWYSDLAFACEKAPDRIDFLFRKAVADEEAGRIADYKQILTKKSLHPDANTNLGYAALQEGNFAAAENYLKNALKGDPDKILARENLARCYIESGKFTEAKQELGRLQKARPKESRYAEAMKSLP